MSIKVSRKNRLNPSKLLVLFLYGTYPYMEILERSSDWTKIQIKIGGFAKLLRVRNAHIVEYLEWLEQMGFISVSELTKTTAKIAIIKPGNIL